MKGFTISNATIKALEQVRDGYDGCCFQALDKSKLKPALVARLLSMGLLRETSNDRVTITSEATRVLSLAFFLNYNKTAKERE